MGDQAEGNVDFDFGAALELAQRFYAMAGTISAYQGERAGYAKTAQQDWKGRYATDFSGRMATAGATAAELEAACRSVAGLWAQAWQHAAWQQQNIEWSRYCKQLDDKRSLLQKGWDSLFGDPTKYPPAPKEPPLPAAPSFTATINPYSYQPPS